MPSTIFCTGKEVMELYSWNRNRIKRKRTLLTGGMAVLIGLAFFCILLSALSKKDMAEENSFKEKAVLWMQGQINRTYMPVFAFVEEETGMQVNAEGIVKDLILSQAPIYKYSEEQAGTVIGIEDEDTYDLLIRQEGSDEERKEVEDGSLEYDNDALHIDGDLQRAMMEENGLHNLDKQGKGEEAEGNGEALSGEQGEDLRREEEDCNNGTEDKDGEFQKAERKSYEYDWKELHEYEDIVSAFYAVDKTTTITDKQLNLENLLNKDMKMKAGADEPQILIYHTHSQEAFVDSVKGDMSTTIVGAGERLAEILREKYGFNVLHHTGEYDVEARDYAYSNALPAIEQVLAQNPSIEVVIDLHRDAVAEGRKLVVNLQGRPTAQFMFFNGLSRTREKGDISYLVNPYINENLAFSFQAQVACNEYYPGVARRIYLKAYRYNMHLRAKCMLVELGAQTNTVEEIMNACDPLAHVIAKVLSGETGDQAREAAGL